MASCLLFARHRGDLTAVLHDSGRGGTTGRGGRLRHGLVVVQVAGLLMLLLIARVFVQNLRRAERADLGFEPDDVLTMRLHHSPVGAMLA